MVQGLRFYVRGLGFGLDTLEAHLPKQGFQELGVRFLGVSIMRVIVVWGLYWHPP